MLNLYQSNTVEALASLWLAVRQPPADPLTPETLLVPSKGMQRWLALWLARETGIAANLDFQLPASFVWRLIQKAIPGVPARSDFDPDVMVWRVLAALPAVLNAHPDASIAGSWNAAPARGKYQLAWRVADVFDQYLIYRADWISQWERGRSVGLGPDESWQADLWRALMHEGWHRGRLLQTLEQRLAAGTVNGLPDRICLFGINTLPPSYWSLVSALGQHVDVDCFLLNPSREFWGHARRGQEDSHALLAALGQQGRDFINAVASSDINEPVGAQAFITTHRETLLGVLQNDLLDLNVRDQSEQHLLAEDDDSVLIHVCHSALREVEVLHDRLAQLFEGDQTLAPDDVLVMVSDIQRYAPLFDAVFGTRHEPAIPYTIADRKLDIEVPLLRRFFDLLALSASRFELPRVLSLFEEPALRARFGLEAADIPLIQRWCEELQLRWGRDEQDRRQRGLADAPITWRAGLDRLLLGFTLPSGLAGGASIVMQGVAPADLVGSVSQARIMARFADVIESLLACERHLQKPRTLSDWSETLEKLLQDFFEETEDSQEALQVLRDAAAELREQAGLAKDESRHDFSVLQAWLKRQVQSLESRRGFLHGAVTVCAMVPMRSLPFRVIAVLGLDDGVFPRHQKPWHFDLMAAHARAGDRSRRLDDRYLFLETLMAVRERLHLSYIGRSDLDDSVRAPSPVLFELMDQIRDTAVSAHADVIDAITVHHALQPFDARYFAGAPRYPSRVTALADISESLLRDDGPPARPFHQPLGEPEADWHALTPLRLEQFFRHPVRFLLSQRMGVRLEAERNFLLSDEPVDLRATERLLRQTLLVQEGDMHEAIHAQGLIPAGAWGESLLQEEKARIADLREEWLALQEARLPPYPFVLERGVYRIQGEYENLSPDGLLRWTVNNRIYDSDVLSLWIQHVLLCCIQPPGVDCRSRLLGLDGALTLEPIADPERHLDALLAAYESGLRVPLPLFKRASPAWIKSGGDMARATTAYIGNEYGPGDADDPWNRLVWGDVVPLDKDFQMWSERIYGPLKDYLT